MQTLVAAVLQDAPCRPSTPTGSSLHITWVSRSCASPRPAARRGAARRAAHLSACCPAAHLRWLWEYTDAGRGTNDSVMLDALERAGQRDMLATGWGGLTTAELPHVSACSLRCPRLALSADGGRGASWRRGHHGGRAASRCAESVRSLASSRSGAGALPHLGQGHRLFRSVG